MLHNRCLLINVVAQENWLDHLRLVCFALPFNLLGALCHLCTSDALLNLMLKQLLNQADKPDRVPVVHELWMLLSYHQGL